MISAFNRSILALTAIFVVAAAGQANAQQKALKKYESGTKEFWTHPPDDWFLGDETEAQKGLAPPSGPPTGASDSELANIVKKVKLPAGLKKPTGLAVKDGALYVIAVDKLIRYDDVENKLDNLGEGKVVYDDMPSYAAHGWKYIAVDKEGWFFLPFGPPFNIGIPPTSVSQIRRVDPKTGNAEIWALGVRNSVGGDVDPRTGKYWFTENARDWVSDDLPSDKLNMINK